MARENQFPISIVMKVKIHTSRVWRKNINYLTYATVKGKQKNTNTVLHQHNKPRIRTVIVIIINIIIINTHILLE